MDELDQIGKTVSHKFPSCTIINTRHEILDAMIACWMTDTEHGTKSGYTKLAMKLVERMEADTSFNNAPYQEGGCSPPPPPPQPGSSGNSARNVQGRGEMGYGRRDSTGSSYTAFTVAVILTSAAGRSLYNRGGNGGGRGGVR
jgi:hypothetical protein